MTNPALAVEVQYAVENQEGEEPPSSQAITQWAQTAYQAVGGGTSEMTVRLVDQPEMAQLNRDYRGKDGTTNVLSFAFDVDPDIELMLLGDVVICHQVLVAEARQQNKSLHDHYAHMVTHGVLHLCGFDHQNPADAQQMEALEVVLLSQGNVSDPYS